MARIAELMGTPLFPGQRYAYDVALEVQSEEAGDPSPGEWAYDEVADFEPRRAGKTFKIGPLVAHRCGSARGRSAWITAQKAKHAARRWHAVRAQLMGSPLRKELRARVGKGDEQLRWPALDSTFMPFAPDSEDMHGEDPDLVIVDELWSHDLEAKSQIEQGYKPAWLVKPGQAWLLSAAGTDKSEWMNLVRLKGRRAVAAGQRRRIAIFDWSVPEEYGGIVIDELPNDQLLEVVFECHPRRDHGLRRAYLVDELEDMGRVDFLRAYGNRTASGAARTVIEWSAWQRATPDPRLRIPVTARVGLGVGVDKDGRQAAVLSVWRTPTGTGLVEVLRVEEGTQWVASYVKGVVARQQPGAVAFNNAGAARDIGDALAAPGVLRSGTELLRLPVTDYAAACARVDAEVTGPRPSVLHDGGPVMSEVMKATGKLNVGGGWVWAPKGEQPVAVMEGWTLGVWAHDHMPAAPARFKIA